MNDRPPNAYTTKQWFWAVNLVAVLAASTFLIPSEIGERPRTAVLFPYALVIALIIAWVFVAPALAYAMRKPASWLRAAAWGGCVAAGIALVGFALATVQRLKAQADPTFDYTIGGGNYVRDVDGVLTPYGWWVVVQTNSLFIVLGVCIALVVRAVIGPGRTPS